jgi:nickel superoxide dismutase
MSPVRILSGLFLTALLLFPIRVAFSHCEIPCGIYDDSVRITMLEEHITTMEKGMTQIRQLQEASPINYNQLVRWITNKDEHAAEFQGIVWRYFLTQRIKPAEESDAEAYVQYQKQLTVLHQMLVYAMKCKQTIDQVNIDKLRDLTGEFRELYFIEKEHDH